MRRFWLCCLVWITALFCSAAHAESFRHYHQSGGHFVTSRPVAPLRAQDQYFQAILDDQRTQPQPVQSVPTNAQQTYDVVEGEVNSSLPLSPTEIIVSGQRIFSGPGAITIFEDNSRARYFDVADVLRRDVIANGPRRVRVFKYPGGASFAYVQLLPR